MQNKEFKKQLKSLEINIDTLNEGFNLLTQLTDTQYTQGFRPAFQSTIGAHFRHILEHYRCFINQFSSGTFCYDERKRDENLEQDRGYAVETIESLLLDLKNFEMNSFSQKYQFMDQQIIEPVRTNLERELLFLQSHSVHHYAIIAAMTRLIGEHPVAEFGVAFATRTFNEEQAYLKSKKDEEVVCAQ